MIVQCMICKKYKWGENDWRAESPDPADTDISDTTCGSDFCNSEFEKKFFEDED